MRHHLFAGVDRYTETLDQRSAGLASPAINVYAPVRGPASRRHPSASRPPRRISAARCCRCRTGWSGGDWSAVAGLRTTRQDFLYGAAGTAGIRESDTSPRLALLRKLSASDSVYVAYSTGIAPNQAYSASGQSLPSRASRQYEAGWKALWNGGRLQSDLAVYRLRQTHLLADDPSTPNIYDKTIAGTGRSQGIEASLSGDLARRIGVAFAYAYTDARYGANADYPGRRIPNVARHALSLWGQYRWSAEHATGVGIQAQGSRRADIANTTTLPGYARVDLSHTWKHRMGGGLLELQVALRNVFDKAYFVSSHLHVSNYLTPGPPRNIYASAGYSF